MQDSDSTPWTPPPGCGDLPVESWQWIGGQGAGRGCTLSERVLGARLCSWHYICHSIYLSLLRILGNIFPLHRWEDQDGYPGSEWQKQVSDLRHSSSQNKLPVGGEQHRQLPSLGFQRQGNLCRPQQSQHAAKRCWHWSWIFKDAKKCSRKQRVPKRGPWEKHREKCFKRMAILVAENFLCGRNERCGETAGMEKAGWHHPAHPATSATILAQDSGCQWFNAFMSPPSFTWQALPSPCLPGGVFPGLLEICQIPPGMSSLSRSPQPDAISLDSNHPEFFYLFNIRPQWMNIQETFSGKDTEAEARI